MRSNPKKMLLYYYDYHYCVYYTSLFLLEDCYDLFEQCLMFVLMGQLHDSVAKYTDLFLSMYIILLYSETSDTGPSEKGTQYK